MLYPFNEIVPDIDRPAQESNNLQLGQESQSFQANKRRDQGPRWKIGQKEILLSQNMNLPNDNKKMMPRWLEPFPITQVYDQRNNYTLDLSSITDLRQIHKTFHIGLLKAYRENKRQELPQRPYSEPGPMKDDRYEVENVVDFRFSHPAREPLHQIRWDGYLPSQEKWIHRDEIDEELKFKFWQGEDLKPTWQGRRCHRGRPRPRKRSCTLSEIQAVMDSVMQCIIWTSAVRFDEPIADQLFHLFMKG